MILILLLYYRSYITQEFVGYLFDLDKSRVCRIIQKLEPILATVIAISKRKRLSRQEVECLIIDATEQPIERPKKGKNLSIQGKRNTTRSKLKSVLILKVALFISQNQNQARFMILNCTKQNLQSLKIQEFLLIQGIRA